MLVDWTFSTLGQYSFPVDHLESRPDIEEDADHCRRKWTGNAIQSGLTGRFESEYARRTVVHVSDRSPVSTSWTITTRDEQRASVRPSQVTLLVSYFGSCEEPTFVGIYHSCIFQTASMLLLQESDQSTFARVYASFTRSTEESPSENSAHREDPLATPTQSRRSR